MTYDKSSFDYGLRYSEDIDLVQINPGPIKPILFWMESEVPPIQPIRLKIEINCFERFNVLGLRKIL